MQGNPYLNYQGAFGNLTETDKKQHCSLRIQTWVYIHSGISIVTSLLGITLGSILLVRTEWHEKLFLYRLTLAYLRRSDPSKYWIVYRVFFGVWIAVHSLHLVTIVLTVIGVHKTNLKLLKPQLFVLVFQIGLFILGISSLFVYSMTGTRVAWLALFVVLFHTLFASTNLYLLAKFHRFLDEKLMILRDILSAQAKSVHFKDDSSF
ncbi:hypothetical protein GCK72_017738 [Caenorhabditis remanei]|uniref:Uncharacterized protein n=1 Tax=Caenorhabditis remanei TaxID=31234 RepID=E3LU86_CAERE|nr:hypothetical protein GCK72_017738 [Caenorhabditis remanei]EFP11103.1 hypothetical protein CRE_30779 [Caenorhabditis remanei]KAF1751184.1 hypothetical protein GCK72_017738 [Caenorhabditis remanei]